MPMAHQRTYTHHLEADSSPTAFYHTRMPMVHERTYTQWYTTWMPTGSPTDLHTRTHTTRVPKTTWMPMGSPTDLHTQLGCRSPTDLHTPLGCRWLASRRIHTTCMPMVSHGTDTLHQSRFHLTPAGIRDGNFVSVSPPAVLTSRSSCQHRKLSISNTPHGFHRNYANQLRSALHVCPHLPQHLG